MTEIERRFFCGSNSASKDGDLERGRELGKEMPITGRASERGCAPSRRRRVSFAAVHVELPVVKSSKSFGHGYADVVKLLWAGRRSSRSEFPWQWCVGRECRRFFFFFFFVDADSVGLEKE